MPDSGKLLANWQQGIARPVLTSLLTTLAIFLASLAFKPVRSFLFPAPPVAEYPILCTAEPYSDNSGKLLIDFFLVNRTGKEYTREDLTQILKAARPDLGPEISPDIRLKFKTVEGRPVGVLERIDAANEDPFNAGKGDLQVSRSGHTVVIVINHIVERAIMKVTMTVARQDLPQEVRRTATILVPFDFAAYQDACYTRP